MTIIKKHYILIIVALVVLVVGFVTVGNNKKHYALTDFGVAPLLKADCSSVKNTNAPYSMNVSFDVPDVLGMRDKVKTLVTKYAGQVTNDSFTNYPGSTPNTSSANANITITFAESQNTFLTELSTAIKSSGGVETNSSYSDGSGYSSNSGYSPYTSCSNSMQSVSADVLQLGVLTKALKEEKDSTDIVLLSQSIASAKSTLQNDVDTMNNFFATSDKPSVTISLNTLQK